jgi:hypothetical protein
LRFFFSEVLSAKGGILASKSKIKSKSKISAPTLNSRAVEAARRQRGQRQDARPDRFFDEFFLDPVDNFSDKRAYAHVFPPLSDAPARLISLGFGFSQGRERLHVYTRVVDEQGTKDCES